jgi:hypothetical protein
MIATVAIGSDEFKDTSSERSLGVQIVSPPPDLILIVDTLI